MSVLTPAVLPPTKSRKMPPSETPVGVFYHPVVSPRSTGITPDQPSHNITGRIPLVTVDQDVITDDMAARLATSLVGHVLFLKSQVPFPVTQLARIPGGNTNARAVKMRNELVGSFDTLTSHLSTTFTALSTAIALASRASEAHLCEEREHACGVTGVEDAGAQRRRGRPRVYLAILVGPTIGTAWAKVLLGVDGLEMKVWGERDDCVVDVGKEDGSDEDAEEEEEEDEEEEEEEVRADSEESDGYNSGSGSENECPPSPPSRSPSPYTRLCLPSPPSYAEEQQVLRAADRLLSRVLADADGDGRSMACELAPTQTHILIRAPRRFKHPAWIPRQNMTNSLEGMLDEFLDISNMGRHQVKERRKGKASVEGVWVRTRCQEVCDSNQSDVKEMEDMIWWSWEGKIAGFADW